MSEAPEVYKFSLRKKQIQVMLENEDGSAAEYFVREMAGPERDRYLNAMSRKAEADGRVKDWTGMISDIIKACLHDAKGVRIPPAFVDAMPTTVQAELFKLCNKVNVFNPLAVEEAKND